MDKREKAQIEGQVRIELKKDAGESTYRRRIEASDARTLIDALAILVIEFAKLVDMDISQVLSRLTVELLAPTIQEDKP